MPAVVTHVRNLVETPFTEPLDAVHLFLIVGVVLISIGFWHLILGELSRALPLLSEV